MTIAENAASKTNSRQGQYITTTSGNLTGDGTAAYTYSDRGRLQHVLNAGVTTNYLYNGGGQRVAKFASGGVTYAYAYAYDEQGQLLGEYDGNGKPVQETVYLEGTPVAVLKTSTATDVYYVYADHINTPRVITTSTDDAVMWRWDGIDPFGQQQPNENPLGNGTFTYNPRFPGQLYDRESNHHYNYYRDYDPQTGRYVQSDPIGLKGGINTYGYVGANPISKFDPLGLQEGSLSPGRGTLPGPFDVFVPGTQANNYFVSSVWNLFKKRPAEASSFPPGVWPGDKGADEWGRRNGHGAKE